MVGKKKVPRIQKKIAYDKKLCEFLDEYIKVLVVDANNVSSNQMQNIRKGLRGESVLIMGKNTMMRRSIKIHAQKVGNKDLLNFLPLLTGNVGLIFTKGDLKEVREELAKYKVGAPARVGLIAPVDVIVPPGNTGLDPSQTSFFQALNIPTKINKGTVEIVTPVELIKRGEKVGNSAATLLSKLAIRPFSYGLNVLNVYDNGSVYGPEILDLTDEDLVEKFMEGVSVSNSLALGISYPTLAAAISIFMDTYKNLLAFVLDSEYSYPTAEDIKRYVHEYLQDPSKFVMAAVGGSDASAPMDTVTAPTEEVKKEEAEDVVEDDDDTFGFDLFG